MSDAAFALLGVLVGGGAYVLGVLLWLRYEERRFWRWFNDGA